jgi:phosphoglycerol transferase MdoB-like AlkP superfamily enzyme
VPQQYKGKFPKGPLPVQECLGYTDMALRKFFATAENLPWFKNTLFVITADHATVSHFPEYQNIQGAFAIPILMYYPGGNLQERVSKLAQQIDIMPTVLSLLHYDKPYFAFGNDLMAKNQDQFVINNNDGNYNFYMNDYVLFSDGEKSTGLYNLKQDRLLKKNRLNALPATRQKMEHSLKAFIQQYNNRMIHDKLNIH